MDVKTLKKLLDLIDDDVDVSMRGLDGRKEMLHRHQLMVVQRFQDGAEKDRTYSDLYIDVTKFIVGKEEE